MPATDLGSLWAAMRVLVGQHQWLNACFFECICDKKCVWEAAGLVHFTYVCRVHHIHTLGVHSVCVPRSHCSPFFRWNIHDPHCVATALTAMASPTNPQLHHPLLYDLHHASLWCSRWCVGLLQVVHVAIRIGFVEMKMCGCGCGCGCGCVVWCFTAPTHLHATIASVHCGYSRGLLRSTLHAVSSGSARCPLQMRVAHTHQLVARTTTTHIHIHTLVVQIEGRGRADTYRSLTDTFDMSTAERPRAESTTSIATVDGDDTADKRGFG
jgi:hypothetical protein